MNNIRILTIGILLLFAYPAIFAQTNTKTLSEPSVVRYIIGGFVKDQKIRLGLNYDNNPYN